MLTSNQILPCSPSSSYYRDHNFIIPFYYLQFFISSFHFWSISPTPRIWAAPVPLLLSTASLYSPTFSSPHSINSRFIPSLTYYFLSTTTLLYSIYQFIQSVSINQHPSVCLRPLRLMSFSPAVRTWLAGNPSSLSVLALLIGRCVR